MMVTVGEQIKEILAQYEDHANEVVAEAAVEVAKETVKILKQTSPKSRSGRKHYASQWAMKQQKNRVTGGVETVVYNKKYRLTHLLERGHVIKNQYDQYGRTSAYPHIGPAEEKGNEMFLRKVEERL